MIRWKSSSTTWISSSSWNYISRTAITRRCRYTSITARVCKICDWQYNVRNALLTLFSVWFSITCAQARRSQLSAEHQWPDAALALEPPARNPPTRQRHVWLLPPVCRFSRHPRLPGGVTPASYQVNLRKKKVGKKSFSTEGACFLKNCNTLMVGLFASAPKHFPTLKLDSKSYSNLKPSCETLARCPCRTVTKWRNNEKYPCFTEFDFVSVGPVCLGRWKARGWTATLQPRAKIRSSLLWRAWCLAVLMSSKFPQMWVNPLCLHAKALKSVTF